MRQAGTTISRLQTPITKKKGPHDGGPLKSHSISSQFGGGLKPPEHVLPPEAVKSIDATRLAKLPVVNTQRPVVPGGLTDIVAVVAPVASVGSGFVAVIEPGGVAWH